jgi:hypothetical protein
MSIVNKFYFVLLFICTVECKIVSNDFCGIDNLQYFVKTGETNGYLVSDKCSGSSCENDVYFAGDLVNHILQPVQR